MQIYYNDSLLNINNNISINMSNNALQIHIGPYYEYINYISTDGLTYTVNNISYECKNNLFLNNIIRFNEPLNKE